MKRRRAATPEAGHAATNAAAVAFSNLPPNVVRQIGHRLDDGNLSRFATTSRYAHSIGRELISARFDPALRLDALRALRAAYRQKKAPISRHAVRDRWGRWTWQTRDGWAWQLVWGGTVYAKKQFGDFTADVTLYAGGMLSGQRTVKLSYKGREVLFHGAGQEPMVLGGGRDHASAELQAVYRELDYLAAHPELYARRAVTGTRRARPRT